MYNRDLLMNEFTNSFSTGKYPNKKNRQYINKKKEYAEEKKDIRLEDFKKYLKSFLFQEDVRNVDKKDYEYQNINKNIHFN